jgi:hypothetical protein
LAQNQSKQSWWHKALGYFYFKVGKGEGFGVKDLKIGPLSVNGSTVIVRDYLCS